MHFGRAIAAILTSIVCAGAGCQILAGLHDELVIGVPADAGTDADLGCTHATVPLPPDGVDDPANDMSFVTAIRAVRFEAAQGAEPIGLDLDRYCTCQGETPSCIAPMSQDPDLACDAPGGRDNLAPDWLRILTAVLLFDPETGLQDLGALYSSFADIGKWSVLVRVSGYNGMPNDPKVRVDWLPSEGVSGPPTWNGNDVWPVSPNAVQPNGDPRYFDTDAYVTNNQLVFSLMEADLRMGNGQSHFGIRISDGTVMATLAKEASGQYALRKSVFAGRVTTENMFRMLTEFRNHNGQPFCADVPANPYWFATREALCRTLDIQAGSPQPNKSCDATSFAIEFDADPVSGPGPIEAVNGGQMNCAPGADPLTAFLDAGCPSL